jgi:hypothetical protein
MTQQENEGEGSRTAAKAYNEQTKKFATTGDVEGQARKAAEALDSSEGDELRRAEEEGRAKRAADSNIAREP